LRLTDGILLDFYRLLMSLSFLSPHALPSVQRSRQNHISRFRKNNLVMENHLSVYSLPLSGIADLLSQTTCKDDS